jgi:TolA-binding protein
MTSLPPEVERARKLLHAVGARKGAEARIYRRIIEPAQRRQRPGFRFSIVTVGMLLSASAALGFGLASRIEQPIRFATPTTATAAPKLRAPRQQPRGAAASVPARIEAEATDTDPADPADLAPLSTLVLPASSTDGVVSGLPPKATTSAALPAAVEPVSDLGQQVADYREAVAHLDQRPGVALESLRAYRHKWQNSAILHEVDLRIIQALVSLGRSDEAADAARKFLKRYPDSARAAEVRRIAEWPEGNGDVD